MCVCLRLLVSVQFECVAPNLNPSVGAYFYNQLTLSLVLQTTLIKGVNLICHLLCVCVFVCVLVDNYAQDVYRSV